MNRSLRMPWCGRPWCGGVSLVTVLILIAVSGCATDDAAEDATDDGEPILPHILEIGGVAANADEAFVLIGRIAIDSHGGIVVLDPFAPRLSWFGADGRFIRDIGRAGSGPGEFRRPASITFDADGRLHIHDEQRRQISVYALQDTVAVHVEDQQVEWLATDLCAIGNRRFLLLPTRAEFIAEIDARGAIIHSFGSVEQPDNAPGADPRIEASIRAFANSARLACDSDSEVIFVLHENTSLVRAFTANGVERWRTTLGAYHAREIHATGSGISVLATSADGSSHSGVAAALLPDDLFMVTLLVTREGEPVGRLDARLLDARTGEELARSTPPARLVVTRGGKYYAIEQFPAPIVFVFDSPKPWLN
jgi:hypothetical protein